MLRLCGFTASNYHNKVKLALLEKNIPFEEVITWPSKEAGHMTRSPMGKLPFIEIDGETITESQAIVEYLEDAYRAMPLYPSDPVQRAHVRELLQYMELYLEWPARRLYLEAFFGRQVSDATKAEVKPQLEKGVQAFARRVKFDPFIAGKVFTYADCAACMHLPTVSQATKAIYGEDPIAAIPGLKEYAAMVRQRPHAITVNDDRKKGMEEFMARRK
ncbi:MAG: glutathione S-transferase [Pseudomonadota bacterium]|nr:glutathione S-transferase [Pseudomonadota bacterium]